MFYTDSKADTEKQKIIKEMTRVALTLPPGPFKAFAFPLVKPDLEFNTLGALSAAPIPVVGDGSAGRPQTTAISATEKKLMEQDPVFYDIHATTEEPSSFLLPLQASDTINPLIVITFNSNIPRINYVAVCLFKYR